MSEVHVEQVLGRRVYDANGKSIGRIEEIVVARDGNHYLVDEIHIGTAAFLERMATTARLFFTGPRPVSALIARWDQIDLREPRRPVLTCPADELRKVKSPG